jgi:uncharacterized DUF497 family protein
MTERLFTWDPIKDRKNLRKHRIGFDEASRVFLDPLHVSVQDRIEEGEARWQTIGQVGGALLLLVAHTMTDDEDEEGAPVEIIHIISARDATRQERRRYEQGQDR